MSDYDAHNDPAIRNMMDLLDFADRSENTKKAYLTYTTPFVIYCHDVLHKSPDMVNHAEIRQFLTFIQEDRKLQNRTVNHAISELKYLLVSTGFEWDDFQVPHKNFSSPVLYVPTNEEVLKLIDSIDDTKKRAMVILMRDTGIRVSELCKLKCQDVYTKKLYIHIEDGKGRYSRDVPICERTVESLTKYWEELPKSKKTRDWLFTQERNISNQVDPEYIQKFMKRHQEAMGCPDSKRMTPHTLRRAYATHQYIRGVTIERLSKLMGHHSIASTMIYVHLAESLLAQSIKSGLDGLEFRV